MLLRCVEWRGAERRTLCWMLAGRGGVAWRGAQALIACTVCTPGGTDSAWDFRRLSEAGVRRASGIVVLVVQCSAVQCWAMCTAPTSAGTLCFHSLCVWCYVVVMCFVFLLDCACATMNFAKSDNWLLMSQAVDYLYQLKKKYTLSIVKCQVLEIRS